MPNEAAPYIPGHDTIVVGASSGGFAALQVLVRDLPEDLPAAIFVVMHVGMRSHLAELLGRRTRLPVLSAESGTAFRPGCIYVARPGKHLLIQDGHTLLRRGPRENMARPAIDPLFRSAAASRGGRVIGVVLSGALNDGSAGLRAIKRCGGLAVVQDPEDAANPSMPRSAMRHVDVDQLVPIDRMAETLSRLAREPAGITPEIPHDIRIEVMIAAQELAGMETEETLGELSPFTCPECNGTLWAMNDGSMLRYRCHVGHAFTAESVLSGRAAELDRMLESLLRSHQERAALVRRLARHERLLRNESLAAQFEARALEYDQDAEVLRRLARRRQPVGAEEGDLLGHEAAEDQEG